MKRRQRNEGTIYQRADKYWCAAIYIDGVQKTKTVKTSEDAVKALEELKELKKKPQGKQDMPFMVYLLEYMKQNLRHRIRPHTYKNYACAASTHILPIIGNIPVNELKPSDIQSVYNSILQKGLAGGTVNISYSLIKQAIKAGVPDVFSYDISANAQLPSKEPKQTKRLFTDEEADKFYKVVQSSTSPYKDILLVYWETGGRISEILGLKKQYCFTNYIKIESVFVRGNDFAPKTKASERKIYLSQESMAIINSHISDSDYVFADKDGKPYNYHNWHAQWRRWLVLAFGEDTSRKGSNKYPILNVTPHALRHMQAVRLKRAGWDDADIEKRGGWQFGTKVLRKVYLAHSEDERQQKMVLDAVTTKSTTTTTDNSQQTAANQQTMPP